MGYAFGLLTLFFVTLGVGFNALYFLQPQMLQAWLEPIFRILETQEGSEALFILLFLPIFSIPIIFMRNMIGVKTYGVFVPLIMGYTFIQEGLLVGIYSYAILIACGVLADRVLVSMNLLAPARRSLGLFFLGLGAAVFFVIFTLVGWPVGFLGAAFIIIVTLQEKFTTVAAEKSLLSALWILAQTFFTAIIVYLLNSMLVVQLDPALMVTLFCAAFCVNIWIATYTGPRLLEYWRFRRMEKGFMGMNERNMSYIEPLNSAESRMKSDDKILSKKVLQEAKVPVIELMEVITLGEEKEVEAKIRELKTPFVLKPNHGYKGKGILVVEEQIEDGYLDIKGRKWSEEDLAEHVREILHGEFSLGEVDVEMGDECLIEQKLVPPSFFLELAEEGLPDVRVIYYHQEPIAAMMRIPTAESEGKANVALGALAASLDVETGEILHVQDKNGEKKNLPSVGFVLPEWEKLVTIGAQAAEACGLGYAGADIVYDQEKGPIIMEVNARPGLEIQNVTGINLSKKIQELQERRSQA